METATTARTVYIASICNRHTEGHDLILGVFSSQERVLAFAVEHHKKQGEVVRIEDWQLDVAGVD